MTYNNKYNLSNGEDNRDGENHNLSWNCGEVILKYHASVCLMTCLSSQISGKRPCDGFRIIMVSYQMLCRDNSPCILHKQ